VIVFLSWKADWWREQGYRRTDVSDALAEGLRAYADKQANIYRSLASKYTSMWYTVHTSNDIPIQWPTAFLPISPTNAPFPPRVESDYDMSEEE
jgi:hypothetical protein